MEVRAVRVFVNAGTGALGRPAVRRLNAGGHRVVALAPVVAGHAAAGGRGGLCPKPDYCPFPPAVPNAVSAADGGLTGSVLREASKPGLLSGPKETTPHQETGTAADVGPDRDASKPTNSGDVRDPSRAPQASPDRDASRPTGTGDF
jgi:hypothetical protein